MNKDYYSTLGISKTASDDEISKAYRKMAMKYHPDRQHGKSEAEKKESEDKFKEVTEAYEVLNDKEKRKYYDAYGCAPGQNNGFGGGGHSVDPREFFRQHFAHMGGFGHFPGFGDFSDFGFDNPHGGSDNNENCPVDGEDVKIRANISFEDAIYGATKEFDINFNEHCDHCNGTGSEDGKSSKCPHCDGSGMITKRMGMMIMQQTCPHCRGTGGVVSNKCHKCGGSGRVSTTKHIKINIPRGVMTDEAIIERGIGPRGIRGGKNGDVVIFINPQNNELFERNGLDLITNIIINPYVAIIGGNIDVQTPWGNCSLNIPQATQNGSKFRIKGQGIKSQRGTGDLYVIVNIEIPSTSSKEQKELLTKLIETTKITDMKKQHSYKLKCDEFEKKTKNIRK